MVRTLGGPGGGALVEPPPGSALRAGDGVHARSAMIVRHPTRMRGPFLSTLAGANDRERRPLSLTRPREGGGNRRSQLATLVLRAHLGADEAHHSHSPPGPA